MKADHVRKSIAMQSRCAHLHSELTVAALNAAETGLLRASLNIAKGYSIKGGGGLKRKIQHDGSKRKRSKAAQVCHRTAFYFGGCDLGMRYCYLPRLDAR